MRVSSPWFSITCFPWREDKFFAKLRKNPMYAYTQTNPPLQSHRVPACACDSTGREGCGHALWVVEGLISTNGAHGQCALPKDQPPNASCLLQINGGETFCRHQMPFRNASQKPANSQVFWIGHAMGTAIIKVSLCFCARPVRAKFQLC